RFNKLVDEAPTVGDLENCKFASKIDTHADCDTNLALQKVRTNLKAAFGSPYKMVANCFEAVRVASYALCGMGMKHTVTIGNVLVDGKPRYITTKDSIESEK